MTTPDGWEPSALERDGLLLEREGQPACELKWRVVQGTFSFEKHLKRLTRQHKNVDMRGVPGEETPVLWQESADLLSQSGIRLQSFIWRTPVHKGIGAAMHNPATGLAALVQFFIASDEDEQVAAEVLATFRDYSAGKTIPWAMFGLTARLPAEFVIDTFSFKPGHYQVKYWRHKSAKQAGKLPAGKGAGTALVFERFAPASVLLKGKALADWIGDGVENSPPDSVLVDACPDMVSWAGVAKSSMLRRVLRRESHVAGRIWTPETGNSILGVTAIGTVPVPGEIFTSICESYELV